MEIKTVGDLIEFLNNYEDDTPVCIRKSCGDGYFSDHVIVVSNLYPSGTVSITAGEQTQDFAGEVPIAEYLSKS